MEATKEKGKRYAVCNPGCAVFSLRLLSEITYSEGMLGYAFTYVLGAIPFGLIFTWLGGEGDVRQVGSGNIGATNVLRTGRKGIAALTILCDGLKGALPLFLFPQLDPSSLIACAVIGHVFPFWLKFKGGKGVATALGGYLAAFPVMGVAVLGIWLAVVKISRLSSLAALISFSFAPIIAWIFYDREVALFAVAMAGFLLWTHRHNFYRMCHGQELEI